MTNQLLKSSSLMQIINNNNISIDFLSSSLQDDTYHTKNFNYNNLLWKFSCFENYLYLLSKSKKELLKLRVVGENSISKLEKFLAIYNCEIGMFQDITTCQINSILNKKISICDLTKEETYLSLILLKSLVNYTPNDTDLGKEIRKIFNTIK